MHANWCFGKHQVWGRRKMMYENDQKKKCDPSVSSWPNSLLSKNLLIHLFGATEAIKNGWIVLNARCRIDNSLNTNTNDTCALNTSDDVFSVLSFRGPLTRFIYHMYAMNWALSSLVNCLVFMNFFGLFCLV